MIHEFMVAASERTYSIDASHWQRVLFDSSLIASTGDSVQSGMIPSPWNTFSTHHFSLPTRRIQNGRVSLQSIFSIQSFHLS